MKTDRELLELAAKAAGKENMWFANNGADSCMFFHQPNRSVYGVWNPLTDDGDALRLAVKLGLTIYQWPDEICACNEKGTINEAVAKTESIYAATRRAIVRAAAAIGEAM